MAAYYYLKKCEDVDWIQLAQDRVQDQVLVNTVITLYIP
jgi:hypothetical protein